MFEEEIGELPRLNYQGMSIGGFGSHHIDTDGENVAYGFEDGPSVEFHDDEYLTEDVFCPLSSIVMDSNGDSILAIKEGFIYRPVGINGETVAVVPEFNGSPVTTAAPLVIAQGVYQTWLKCVGDSAEIELWNLAGGAFDTDDSNFVYLLLSSFTLDANDSFVDVTQHVCSSVVLGNFPNAFEPYISGNGTLVFERGLVYELGTNARFSPTNEGDSFGVAAGNEFYLQLNFGSGGAITDVEIVQTNSPVNNTTTKSIYLCAINSIAGSLVASPSRLRSDVFWSSGGSGGVDTNTEYTLGSTTGTGGETDAITLLANDGSPLQSVPVIHPTVNGQADCPEVGSNQLLWQKEGVTIAALTIHPNGCVSLQGNIIEICDCDNYEPEPIVPYDPIEDPVDYGCAALDVCLDFDGTAIQLSRNAGDSGALTDGSYSVFFQESNSQWVISFGGVEVAVMTSSDGCDPIGSYSTNSGSSGIYAVATGYCVPESPCPAITICLEIDGVQHEISRIAGNTSTLGDGTYLLSNVNSPGVWELSLESSPFDAIATLTSSDLCDPVGTYTPVSGSGLTNVTISNGACVVASCPSQTFCFDFGTGTEQFTSAPVSPASIGNGGIIDFFLIGGFWQIHYLGGVISGAPNSDSLIATSSITDICDPSGAYSLNSSVNTRSGVPFLPDGPNWTQAILNTGACVVGAQVCITIETQVMLPIQSPPVTQSVTATLSGSVYISSSPAVTITDLGGLFILGVGGVSGEGNAFGSVDSAYSITPPNPTDTHRLISASVVLDACVVAPPTLDVFWFQGAVGPTVDPRKMILLSPGIYDLAPFHPADWKLEYVGSTWQIKKDGVMVQDVGSNPTTTSFSYDGNTYWLVEDMSLPSLHTITVNCKDPSGDPYVGNGTYVATTSDDGTVISAIDSDGEGWGAVYSGGIWFVIAQIADTNFPFSLPAETHGYVEVPLQAAPSGVYYGTTFSLYGSQTEAEVSISPL